MSRPSKVGLDYFPMVTDFFIGNNDTVPLAMSYGPVGRDSYLYFVCECYRNGYYTDVGENSFYVAARDLGQGVRPETVKQAVELCCKLGLFDSNAYCSYGILTSQAIQRNCLRKNRERTYPLEVVKEYWLLDDEESAGLVFCTIKQDKSEGKPSKQPGKRSFQRIREDKRRQDETTPKSPEIPPIVENCGKPEIDIDIPLDKLDTKEQQKTCSRCYQYMRTLVGKPFFYEKADRRLLYDAMRTGATEREIMVAMEWAVFQQNSGAWHGKGRWPLPAELFGSKWGFTKAMSQNWNARRQEMLAAAKSREV